MPPRQTTKTTVLQILMENALEAFDRAAVARQGDHLVYNQHASILRDGNIDQDHVCALLSLHQQR
jgi:hypothetical protein